MAVEVDLLNHLGDLLDSGDTKSVKSLLSEETFDHLLEEKANDVIPVAAHYLNKEVMEEKPATLKYSVKVLTKCAEIGNPKECLMEFLAQIESLDELKFRFLLKPIQITLLRIPDRKAPLMICVLNTIYFFVNSLEVPKYHHQDKDSKLLLDCDERFIKIRDTYQDLLSFYEPFVKELSMEHSSDTRIKNLKLALIQALLQLLGCPIVFLDLEEHEKGSSAMRVIVMKIVKFLTMLQNDPLQFLSLVADKATLTIEEEKLMLKEFSKNEFKFSDLSLSLLFYLVLHENLCPSVPQVYDKLFIFQNAVTSAVTLLRHNECLVVRKGLLLAKTAVESVGCRSVSFSYLVSTSHKEIIDLLSNVAVYNEVEENRKLAAELIKKHFLVFEPKAQFYILCKSGRSAQHPNIMGFLTTMLTGLVRESFSDPELKEFFTGKRLHDLMTVFCSLKKGAETDLVKHKDQIISAVNLIIFLTRRDRQNVSGVWNYVHQLSQNFLCPLREGIKLSKGHYKLQLYTLDSDQSKSGGETEFGLTVGGEEIGKMSVEEKRTVIDSCLTVFDLIEHLLSRAEECIEDRPVL